MIEVLKIAKKKIALQAKGRQDTADKVIQRLFNIYLEKTYLAICRYKWSKRQMQWCFYYKMTIHYTNRLCGRPVFECH